MKDVVAGTVLGIAIFTLVHYPSLLPIALMLVLGFVVLRAMTGMSGMRPGFGGLPSSRNNTLAPPPTTTFDDVGGQAAAKRELMEALEFLSQPERVRKLGIRPLKGILLTGPPGTGKTLLAKAAANYTGSVFISCSGSEFIEVYAGVGAQRVREVFRRAREEGRQASAPAVLFIDELEVLGGKRGRHQSHLEYDQTLNQLLVEMDGISTNNGVTRVLVIGATNRVDLLDDAILRPGRFDRIVRVDLPDRDGRRQILELHTRGKPLAADVDLDRIARDTFGFSGAHLESLTNEAAILAMRQGLDEVGERCFREAVDKVLLGEKLERHPSVEERRRIAIHEAGHAIVGELAEPGSVARVTVTSRGQALGYVRQASEDDLYLYTKAKLESDTERLLAGSLAEEAICGNRSTGASSDFEQVMRITRTMIGSGMSDLGVVDLDALPEGRLSREQSRIIARLEQRVRALLEENLATLRSLADILLEEETIEGERLRALLRPTAEKVEAEPVSPRAQSQSEPEPDEQRAPAARKAARASSRGMLLPVPVDPVQVNGEAALGTEPD